MPKTRKALVYGLSVIMGLSFFITYDIANAADGPIKIGIDTELTGVMSETSTNDKMGYDLALGEVGYKVAGRKIKIIEYDNQTNPKIAMEVAQKLVEKDKVSILCFGTNSAAAIAVKQYAAREKVPMVVIGMAGAERVTLPRSKYVFRLTYADGQGERPLGRYAYEKLGLRKMALMGADYVGSTGKLWAFQQAFEKSGGKVLQTILWPLGDMDLAPEFARLKPGVQAIFPFIPGDISINRFLSQYFEMGLDKKGVKLVTHWTMTADYLPVQVFKDKMVGITSVAMYCLHFDSPENRRVTKMYYEKYGRKKMMNSDVAVGYESMKFIIKALQSINGNAEDTDAFIKAMHNTQIEGLVSKKLSVDENGNAIRDFVIRQIQKKDGVVGNVVLDVIPQTHQPPKGYTVMPGK